MKRVMLFALLVMLAAGTAWGGWEYKYSQDVGQRCRGFAVWGADDIATGINYSTAPARFEFQCYHNMPVAPGLYNCMKNVWTCPMHGDVVTLTYNWGQGREYYEEYVYQTTQEKTVGRDSTSVLVWDYNCNPVDRLALGTQHTSTEYPTACDLDAAGNVYVAWYIDGDSPDIRKQVEVWPPRAQWVNHKAPKICQLETGAYVCEGMCVNAAGTVIWSTNRSAIGSWGWVRRFTGSVAGGFTQDLAFGDVPINGYARAVDVDEEHNMIYVTSDGNPGDTLYCIDATSGVKITKIWLDNSALYGGSTFHASPYDIEYEPSQNALYIQHYYGWYIDKWIWYGVAVTMSSFEARAGQEMVDLTWRVESESDNTGFKIYRDGTEIAFVQSQGNSDAPRTYSWVDKDVSAGTTYTYQIASIGLDGTELKHDFTATATPLAASVPTAYSLAQNYPNPFNADTQIEFTLPQAGYTTLKIYNTTGQLVRTLVDGTLDAKVHKVRWDGRNDKSELVSSGIYFYRLSSGSFAETRKMSFLK